MRTHVNIKDISDFTLLYCFDNGISMNPLKLQKILYYIQTWHMVYFNKAMIFDEKPEAWVNGPVYPTIYHQYKDVIGIYDQMTPENTNISTDLESKRKDLELDNQQCAFLESIYQHYGLMSHDRLVFLTHAELPWSEQREGLNPFEPSKKEISFNTMYSYYKNRFDKNRAS